MKILIVDDSKMIKLLIKDYLNKLGHESSDAENGEDGLRMIEEYRPNLILLDYNMPIMDGPTFLKQYKGKLNGPIPVIMMTTESSIKVMQEVISLGASEFLMKPFDQNILQDKITQVVG